MTQNETARAEAEKAQADAEAEMAKYTAELAALGESTGSLTAERERITTELSEKQLQRLADEKDIGLHEAALQGLQSRTGEAEARAREQARKEYENSADPGTFTGCTLQVVRKTGAWCWI